MMHLSANEIAAVIESMPDGILGLCKSWGYAQLSDKLKEASEHRSPLSKQVGGDHYKTAIQPVEFIHLNGLNFLEGCVIKRVCRHRRKAGREDLLKAVHELQLLIELEYPNEEDQA